MSNQSADRPCTGDWPEIEARFCRAKQVLLDAQQKHCDAAHEFLLARAQMRQMLEAVFPGSETLTLISNEPPLTSEDEKEEATP